MPMLCRCARHQYPLEWDERLHAVYEQARLTPEIPETDRGILPDHRPLGWPGTASPMLTDEEWALNGCG